MGVRISRAAHAALLAEAAANPAVEVCGLMLGGQRVERLLYTRNVSENPADSFEIDPTPLFNAIRVERAGGERLIGYYHSHPNGCAEPSERDRMSAMGDLRIWVIVGHGVARAWRMNLAGFFDEVAMQIVD
jgi:desampylase